MTMPAKAATIPTNTITMFRIMSRTLLSKISSTVIITIITMGNILAMSAGPSWASAPSTIGRPAM